MDQITEDTPLSRRVDSHVGSRMRKRRTALGMTQDNLAEAIGISYQQVQKYETGANRISAGRLFEVAKRLGVSVGYFFEGLDPEQGSSPLRHGGRERSTIDLVRSFETIGDGATRQSIIGLVRNVARMAK